MLRLGLVAALSLLPAVADMLPLTPEQCAAVGLEPYASIAEMELPLPPTPEQVKALPPMKFAQKQSALKETLLLRWAMICSAGHRTSQETEAAAAGHARESEAPELLAELYQLMADGNLTRAQSHACLSLMDLLLHAYQTDELAVRLLAEETDMTPEQAAELARVLPLEDAFNLLPLRPPTGAEMLADIRSMRRHYGELAALYAEVQDKESAERVATAALPVVRCLLTTARTLYQLKQAQTQLTPAQSAALKGANEAYALLAQQRSRLQQQNYGDCILLRALDILAE